VCVLVQAVAVALVAARLSGRLARPESGTAGRWLVALVVALTQIVGLAQVLGAVGLLSRGFLLAGHALLTAAVLVLVRPADGARPSRASRPGVAVAALVTVVGCLALVLGLAGRSVETDTIEYHAPYAGFWATSHQIWDPPFTLTGYMSAGYPSNLELSASWLIVAVGDDTGAYSLNVLWGALLVVGAAVLARALGGALWVGGLAGVALILTPLIFSTQVHSLATDVASAAGVVACLALAAEAGRARSPGPWWVAAGLALGLSLGSKYTAVVPSVAAVVAVGWLAAPSASWARRWGSSLRVGGLASLLLVVWVVRNALAFGNPVFPLDVAVGDRVLFEGGDSVLERFDAPMARHLIHLDSEPLRAWGSVARQFIGPALLVIVAGIAAGLLRGRSREGRALAVVALVALAGLVGYLLTPYTGGGAEGAAFLIGSQLRYTLVVQVLAGALFAAAVPRAFSVPVLAVTAAWGLLRAIEGPGFRPDVEITASVALTTVVLASCAGLAWLSLAGQGPSWLPPRGVTVAAVAVIWVTTLAVFVAQHPIRLVPGRVGTELAAAQREGPIMVVGVHDVRALLGPRFEGTLAKVSAGGAADERMVEDPAELTQRIEAARPALVAVGPPQITVPDGWTPPRTWIEVGRHRGVTYYRIPHPDGPNAPGDP
jgi:hypothetical protein